MNNKTMVTVVTATLILGVVGAGGITVLQENDNSSYNQEGRNSPFESNGGPLIRDKMESPSQDEYVFAGENSDANTISDPYLPESQVR